MAFSSLYEEKCPFTRDYNIIKAELQNIDDYDKTCVETAFHGVNQLVLGEWGNNTPCQVSKSNFYVQCSFRVSCFSFFSIGDSYHRWQHWCWSHVPERFFCYIKPTHSK